MNFQITTSKSLYRNEYNNVHSQIEDTKKHFELILNVPQLITHLVGSFRTPIPTYNCMYIPRNTNYALLYLERHYKLVRAELDSYIKVEFVNSAEKIRFVEKLTNKIF